MALVQHFAALSPEAAPVCSVCIANYNGVGVLADCIDSVIAQQGDIRVEIIIHDDASTDDSVAWIRQHYPNVELLAGSENAGFCVANNRMAAHARGEFVLLLNNDAALLPDALATLCIESSKMPKPGILTLPQYDWESGALVDRGCLLDPFYNPVPNLDEKRHEVAYVIGACLFLPRAVWNELGGFPEWLGSIGEDMYLCCLARLRGLAVQVTPGSGYRHRQGASFGGNRVDGDRLKTTYRRRALSERNKTAVMVICTPTVLVWPLLTLHMIALSFEALVLVGVKRELKIWTKIYAAAFRQLWSQRLELLRSRELTQTGRRISLVRYLRVFRPLPHKLVMLLRHGLPALRQ